MSTQNETTAVADGAEKSNKIRTGTLKLVYGSGGYNAFTVGQEKNGVFCESSRSWHTCREGLANDFPPDSQYLIYAFLAMEGDRKPVNPLNLINFINRIESLPRLGIGTRTEFILPENIDEAKVNGCVIIKLSPWWMAFSQRTSLFTALLRCALKYNTEQDNLKEALWSTTYTKSTPNAVKLFLAGFNCIRIKRGRGWRDDFGNKSIRDLRESMFNCDEWKSRREDRDKRREEKKVEKEAKKAAKAEKANAKA